LPQAVASRSEILNKIDHSRELPSEHGRQARFALAALSGQGAKLIDEAFNISLKTPTKAYAQVIWGLSSKILGDLRGVGCK